MAKNKKVKERTSKKRRIADEILAQIGKRVFVVFIAVALVTIVMTWFVVTSSRKSELCLESESASNQLAGFFEKYEWSAVVLAGNPQIKAVLSETTAGNDILAHSQMQTVRDNLEQVVGADSENILSVWIADIDASVLTQSDGFTTDSDWDVTSRAWFSCTETKTPLFTEPYIDSASGDMILSAVAPVLDQGGNAIGAVGIDITMAHVMEVLKEYKIGSNGYVMLLSSSGTLIYHPTEDLIQKTLTDVNASSNIISAVEEQSKQFMRYSLDGSTKYGMVQEAGDTGYFVASSMPMFEYYQTIIFIVIGLLALFLVGTIVVLNSIKRSAASLAQPIMELNTTAQHLAAGDLDVVLDIESENEIGELGNSIGETVSRLKEYIVYLNEASHALDQIADGKLGIELEQEYVGEFQKLKKALLHISNSINEMMHGINQSAGMVSTSADDLSKAAQGLAEGTCSQALSVDKLVVNSQEVAKRVENSKRDAERSASETTTVASLMEHSQAKMNQMMTAVQKIHETSEQVVGIIQTIEEIAEQTNLLSLNASIEAARAGNAGKGFAVVASEIGQLADESSQAANMTRNLISVSMDEINTGKALADEVMKSLEESVGAVNKVTVMINKTAEDAVNQAQSIEHIRTGIEEIAQGIQDNSAIAEESYATSEELASQAKMLNEMVQKFELFDYQV